MDASPSVGSPGARALSPELLAWLTVFLNFLGINSSLCTGGLECANSF